jgi:hypothetical protein
MSDQPSTRPTTGPHRARDSPASTSGSSGKRAISSIVSFGTMVRGALKSRSFGTRHSCPAGAGWRANWRSPAELSRGLPARFCAGTSPYPSYGVPGDAQRRRGGPWGEAPRQRNV